MDMPPNNDAKDNRTKGEKRETLTEIDNKQHQPAATNTNNKQKDEQKLLQDVHCKQARTPMYSNMKETTMHALTGDDETQKPHHQQQRTEERKVSNSQTNTKAN